MAISVIRDGNVYKALVRSSAGSERLSLPVEAVPVPWWRKALHLGPSYSSVLAHISRDIPIPCLSQCRDSNLPNDLVTLEERQVIRSYKFGVTYLRAGQSTEEESYSNHGDSVSPGYAKFLNFLGETIPLSGWKGYRAGLDVSGSNSTGKESVYTKWQGYEIMFHVATFLPFTPNERQQLERKRHIGNDIALLVFVDEDNDKPFQLQTITSHQNHVIAVVQPKGNQYKLTICAKSGVPAFKPELPEPCLLNQDAISRDFLLWKLVNGERASYKAPSFATKLQRTRGILLYDVTSKYLK